MRTWSILFSAICVIACSTFDPSSATEPLQLTRAQVIEDLEYLRSNYLLTDGAFDDAKRARATRIIDRYERSPTPWTPMRLFAAAFEISAASDNGHSHAGWEQSPYRPTTRLPLKLAVFGRKLMIIRALPEYAGLAGGEIIGIDRHPIENVYRRLAPFMVSAPGSLAMRLPMLAEPGGVLHAAGIATDADRLFLRVRLPDGTVVSRTVSMVAAREAQAPLLPGTLITPAQANGGQWVSALKLDAALPLYLQDGAEPFRMVHVSAGDTLYVQLKSQFDVGPYRFADFIANLRKELESGPPTNLIVDLRFDIGGDSSTSFGTFRDLARLVPGSVYVITGPQTASAGMVTAAIFKKYAGHHAVLIGDGVGDHLRFWSEIVPKCMPNSRFCVIANTGLWDLAKGCAGEPGCFGENGEYRVVVGNLEPQLRAPLTAAAYLAGRDPAMEVIARDQLRRAPR